MQARRDWQTPLFSEEVLIVIDGRHNGKDFYAGVIAHDGRVVEVAPILTKHIRKGWDGSQVAAYVKHMEWRWERVHTLKPATASHHAKP